MRLLSLLELIDSVLPSSTALNGDKIGLQIQSEKLTVNNLLFCLEINDEVITEAIYKNCDCIITFHPLIYNSLESILDNDRVGSLTKKIIKAEISVITIHTNFDVFEEGTSKILSDYLGFNKIKYLIEDVEKRNVGMGILAKPTNPITSNELVKIVSDICKSPIRFAPFKNERLIETIAIVGGSGSSFINEVINTKADAFITADISYHVFHKVNGNILLIDPGHYEMEQFVPRKMAELIKDNLKETLGLFVAKSYTNPVRYYPNTMEYLNLQKEYLEIENK